MTVPTCRRALALSLAVAAAVLPSAALSVTTGSPAAAADPSPTPSLNNESPAQVIVTTLAPRAPMDPGEFFRVAGSIVNRGSVPLHSLTVRLRRGDPLISRGQLAAADVDPPATATRVGRTPVHATTSDLAPGASTTFDIRIRVSQLQLGVIGVYPLRIEARGQVGDNPDVGPVGRVQTLIPWNPDGAPHGKIRVAWLWPLVDQPRRGPREIMLDDELARSFRRGGRLDRMIRSAADGAKGGQCDAPAPGPPTLPPRPRVAPCRADPVPMTYAVDPDLLFTADALTSPYQLATSAEKTRRIDDVRPATEWLSAVRTAAAAGDVISLPYADPDVVSLTAPDSGLADEVPTLRELGKRETAATLQRPPLTSVVWPPPGRLTRRSVEALTSGGAIAVVADPQALPAPAPDLNRTPDTDVGRLPTSTGSPAVLTIDSVLSGLLAASPADYPGDRLVEQRWLAETAMVSAEAPSISRTILVAPPRRGDLHTGVAAAAIRDSGRLPWMCAVTLASVAVGTDACSGEVRPVAKASPPVQLEAPHADDPTLSADVLRQIRGLRARSSQFTDEVLANPTSTDAVGTTGRLTRARARAESSAWLDDAASGERLLTDLSKDLADLLGKVHLQIGSGTVTLTSSTGVISVNVVNELDQPVRVGVALNAFSRARLSTQETPVATVEPHQATQINLKVTAQTSGQFPVSAQLVDLNGHPFGAEQTLVVRSTQYGRVALAVTGIGAGVLLAAAGIRIVRRALRRPGRVST
ncbi:MAG: hypothetical protein NVSMB55_00040 [Mycobacteriales bacterium]